MKLRYYQKDAVNSALDYVLDVKNKGKNPLIVLPTGSGKSLVLASICKAILDIGKTAIVLSHVEKIIVQNHSAICGFIDNLRVGMYASGLNRRQRCPITVAMITSVYKKAELFKDYDYIIVDECHLVPSEGMGMYLKFISIVNPYSTIGLTATPFRLKTGHLVYGDKPFFDDVVIDVPVSDLIAEGYLSPIVSEKTSMNINTDAMTISGGDFSLSSIREESINDEDSLAICSEISAYKHKRQKWLIYAVDIQHSEDICYLMQKHGISCTVTHSKLSKEENNKAIDGFMGDEFQCLVNVSKLTTGFDYSKIDLIALLRPTKSVSLYVQMVGRGTRIEPGKEDCLVLDFAGNIERLGPIDNVDYNVKKKKRTKGSAVIKQCPGCTEECPAASRICPTCGYEFPPPQPSLVLKASELDILVSKPKWYPVMDVYYERCFNYYTKQAGIKTHYLLQNGRVVREEKWPIACGSAKYKSFVKWWEDNSDVEAPLTVRRMLSELKNSPKPRCVKCNLGYDKPSILKRRKW